jgi:hypothetical protein
MSLRVQKVGNRRRGVTMLIRTHAREMSVLGLVMITNIEPIIRARLPLMGWLQFLIFGFPPSQLSQSLSVTYNIPLLHIYRYIRSIRMGT